MVDLLREVQEEELGLRIVGGKDTPLGNIVIQEVVRESIAARDGRLAPGDHILEVRKHSGGCPNSSFLYLCVTNKQHPLAFPHHSNHGMGMQIFKFYLCGNRDVTINHLVVGSSFLCFI